MHKGLDKKCCDLSCTVSAPYTRGFTMMVVRLLSHASCPAVSSTPASRTSSLHALSSGPAPPAKQSSCTTSPSVTDKVLCVCGAVSDDGKPMVECTKCGTWSHLQCAHLPRELLGSPPFSVTVVNLVGLLPWRLGERE